MGNGSRLLPTRARVVIAEGIEEAAILTHVLPKRSISTHVPAAAGAATKRPSNNPDDSDEGSRLAMG